MTRKQTATPLLSTRWDSMTDDERIDLVRAVFAPVYGYARGQM